MADHTCAPLSPTPDASPDLFDEADDILQALAQVRDFMRLLSDCACANADGITDMASETLAVAMEDLAHLLHHADRSCSALANQARDATEARQTLSLELEAQSNAIHVVRHLLLALHGVMGPRSARWHQVDSDALGHTMHCLAERIAGVQTRLESVVFHRHAA